MKKKILSLLLAFVMLVSLLPSALAAEPATFNDVAEDMWCFDYVEFVAEEGYFKGTTATTFEPNGTMTRQQFVTVLARMAGVKVDNSKTAFSDVPAGSYSAGSVAWAAKYGIVQGYADGTFKPTAPVTRQQMCAFMSRFMDYYADVYGAYFLKRPTVSTFADYEQVSDYAKTPVDRCRAYGLVQGYAEDNTFRPANTATRAHVAAVIYRLAQVLQFGGSSSDRDGGKTYTLNYVSNPGTEVTDKETNKTGKFTVWEISKLHPDATVYDGQVFLNWTNEAEAKNYIAGAEINLKDLGVKSATLTANWADENDLLYQAIANTADYVMDKGQPKVDEANGIVAPYASLNSMSVATPSDIDANDNSRTITIGAEAELSTDIVSRMIETATYYAVKMIGSPAHFAASEVSSVDAISKAEVREIVAELLDLIDPTEIWWEGEGRIDKIENLASKIYENLKAEAKEHGGFLYNEYYKYNNAVLFTEVSLLDGDDVVVTAKNDKKLYDANDNQVSYKKGVALVAKAVGEQLYASLQTNTEYVTDLCLTGELGLKFEMNEAQDIKAITAPFPTLYNVAVDLDLVQGGDEDYLAYKFDGGRNYVKLIVTTGLQADYEKSVNAIAEAAMTNGKLESELTKVMKDMLTDTIRSASSTDSIGKLLAKLVEYDAQIPGDQSTETKAEDYVLSKLLPAVDLWVAANLSTEGTPTGAPYYLPFDFFWNLGGTVNADGSLNVPTRAAAPVLGNNEDLVDAVELLIEEVVNSVAAPVYDEYGMDPADMEGSIKNLLNDKADEKLTPAKIADLQAQVIDAAADNFDTLKSTIQTEGTKLVKKAATLGGMTEPQFDTYWDGLSSTEKAVKVAEYLDVDEVLTDLFGTTDAAALTIAKIDAAAAYVPADYDEDVETKIKNVNTVAKLEALLPDFAEMVKDTTSETLYTVISEKVNGSMSDVAGSSAYVGDLLQVSYAETYIRELLLGKLGFTQAFNVDRLISGISLEERAIVNMAEKAEEIIDAEIEAERAALGLKAEDVETLLNEAVADACGTYSKYLNEVAAFKTVKGMTDIQLNSLIKVMENETVLNLFGDKVAPKYVEAVAKVVAKLDSVAGSNTSTITINGVTVDMSNDVIDDVKNASDAEELCKAVAEFLKPWGALSIDSFAPEAGIPVDVVASAKGVTYDFGVNFVIEVK